MNQTDIRMFSRKKSLLWAVLILVAVVQIFLLIWLADFSLASSNEMFTSGLLVIQKKIHDYGRLRMPQNELEIKRSCEDASAHGNDDSHLCHAASHL